MARSKTAEPVRNSLKAFRARAAARSQAYRDRAKSLRRPDPAEVDRAIIVALKEIWAQSVHAATANGVPVREALLKPVSLAHVGSLAVSHLARGDRANVSEATSMVSRRLRQDRQKRVS